MLVNTPNAKGAALTRTVTFRNGIVSHENDVRAGGALSSGASVRRRCGHSVCSAVLFARFVSHGLGVVSYPNSSSFYKDLFSTFGINSINMFLFGTRGN